MTGTDLDVKIDEKIKQVVKESDNYKVILMNDDVTIMDFVIDILTTASQY